MDKKDKLKDIAAIKPEKPIDFGDDADSKHKKELDAVKHQNALWLHKTWPWLIKGIMVFLLLLFFIILPLSEMTLKYSNFWEGARDWSRAFLSTASTAAIALATLFISDLVKRVFDYIKKERTNIED